MDLETRERHVIADSGKVRFFPMPVVRGEGNYLITEGGRRLLDLSATWGAASLGYAHPRVVAAIVEAARNMASATTVSNTNIEAVGLAEDLVALLPARDDWRVWFGHCGSDANDAVARMITAATGRSRFISFIGGAHGGSSGALALSGYSALQLHSVGGARTGQVYAPYPDPYRPQFAGDLAQQCLDYFTYLIETIAPSDQIGGVFFEPIMCDAGDIIPPAGFLRRLTDLCRARGILTICDEVKVGLGRTGLLHAFLHEGLAPDFITFGKALGGGLPLAAAVGPAEIMNNTRGLTVTTTAGNPVAAAAGRAVLRTIQEDGLIENARLRGEEMLGGLRRLAAKHAAIGDVRGRGLVIGVDLVTDRDTRAPAKDFAAQVSYHAATLGVAVFYLGHGSNVLELTPPLTITASEVEMSLELLDRTFSDVEGGKADPAAYRAYAGW